MAYAAVHSLAQTTAEIIFLHPVSDNKKHQIRSIYEPFISLKQFLDEFPDETPSNLYDRIKQAAREAEHVIVSIISEENQPQCCAALAGKSKLKRQVKMIMELTNSISVEVRNMKQNKAATTKAAVQIGNGASSSAAGLQSIDSMVGLHEDLIAIKSRLCEESPNLQVIPICGMGGIGKTTLAKIVYDDPLTRQHFDIRV